MINSEQSAGKQSLVGKANSFIQQLISLPSDHTGTSSVFPIQRQPGSPRSLALKRNELELEHMQKISEMTVEIQQKECEIQNLPESVEQNDNRNVLESELKILKEKLASFSNLKLQASLALDAEIGLKQDEEMKEMDEVVSKFKRIVVILESDSIKRTLKPVRYYSDLQAQIETFHPGFTVILSVPGTSQVIGSQFELLCAYQDAEHDVLTLNLKLVSIPKKNKRIAQDESDSEVDNIFVRHAGKWSNSEVQLFKAGVDQYGWGEWSKIASTIQTRDRGQVRTFSMNQRAKKFKSSISLVPALTDLAEGFRLVACSLEGEKVDENLIQ
jgi:hypothetical protein